MEQSVETKELLKPTNNTTYKELLEFRDEIKRRLDMHYSSQAYPQDFVETSFLKECLNNVECKLLYSK